VDYGFVKHNNNTTATDNTIRLLIIIHKQMINII